MKRLHAASAASAVALLLLAGPPTAAAVAQVGEAVKEPASPGALRSAAPVGDAGTDVAQDAVLTLVRAIEEALENNQRLAVAAAAVDEADAVTRQAAAHKLPRIDLSYVWQRTSNPVFVFGNLLRQGNFTEENFALDALNDPAAIDNFTPSVTVVQPLWTGGRITRREEAAELFAEAAELRQARTRQQVVFDTVEAYAGAVLAARHLTVAGEALATAEAHVALAESMLQGGLVVDSDVLQARVQASEAREAVARAESGLAVAETALNFVIGRELTAAVTLPAELDETELVADDLGALVDAALANRPDLGAMDAQDAAAGKNTAAERATLLPEVALSGFAEGNSGAMFDRPSGNWGVMIGATFTVFDGSARSAAIDRALAQQRQVRQQALLLRRAVVLEVTRAFWELRAASESIVHAETAVELARENLRIVENRYREGLSTSVELLDAQTRLTTTQTRVVAGRRDLMLGRAALDLAVGR